MFVTTNSILPFSFDLFVDQSKNIVYFSFEDTPSLSFLETFYLLREKTTDPLPLCWISHTKPQWFTTFHQKFLFYTKPVSQTIIRFPFLCEIPFENLFYQTIINRSKDIHVRLQFLITFREVLLIDFVWLQDHIEDE